MYPVSFPWGSLQDIIIIIITDHHADQFLGHIFWIIEFICE